MNNRFHRISIIILLKNASDIKNIKNLLTFEIIKIYCANSFSFLSLKPSSFIYKKTLASSVYLPIIHSIYPAIYPLTPYFIFHKGHHMTLRNKPSPFATFYCFCSEMSYQDMLEKQKKNPLTFNNFIDKYTHCNQGCGSCIENLYIYLSETNLLID